MSVNGSLTQDIYGQIRDDLITNKLPPGERLKTRELCNAHSVSVGVVREALSRLTAEGFVLAEPQRGFRAPPLSTEELMQLTEATISVEAFCLRRAIATGDLEWGARVTAAFYRFSNMPPQDGDDPSRISKKFTEAYSELRRALVSACDNKWMIKLRELLQAQSERYRQVCMVLGPKSVDFREGYDALIDAVLLRDADRAVSLLEQKLKTNALRMRDALQHSTLLTASPPNRPKGLPKKHVRKARSRAS
jgi:DNA-binding GntR family transcriptional regulator